MSPIRLGCGLLVMGLSLGSAGCFGRGGNTNAQAPSIKKPITSKLAFWRGGNNNGYGHDPDVAVAPKKSGKKAKSAGRSSRAGTQTRPANETNGRNLAYASADLNGIGPDDSLKRDLVRLRELEKKQVKTVQEMRSALTQGQDVVAKEENKLAEIRSQIQEYELAMRQYESPSGRRQPARAESRVMASRERESGDDYVVPASMYADPRSGRGRNSGYEQEYSRSPSRDDYRRDDRYASYTPRDDAPRRDDYSRSPQRGREEAFHDGRDDFRGAAASPSRSQAPAREFYDENPYAAPAPAPRGQPRAPAGRGPEQEEDLWNPSGGLFSRSASASDTPPLPVRNNAAPAKSGSLRPEPQAAAPQARPPEPRMDSARGNYEEEVFSPDMYLTGGR